MLEVSADVQPVKKERKERNAEVKAEIRETLEHTEVGQSFVIEGAVKKATVIKIAKDKGIKVKIAIGTDSKLRCWRV